MSLSLVKLQAFSGMQVYQNKKRLQHRFFCKTCEIFKSTYFEEHPRTTASKLLFREKPRWLNNMRLIDIANTFHKERSSRPKLFCKNVVFKKFTTFTIKGTVSESRFEKSSIAQGVNERLLHRYFALSFTNLTPILNNFCEWLFTV